MPVSIIILLLSYRNGMPFVSILTRFASQDQLLSFPIAPPVGFSFCLSFFL